VNVVLVLPAGIDIVVGTIEAWLSLVSVTVAPPEGAGMFSVTVPVDVFPP
jgi:hypothetical protein